ncbi:MAG: ankyrin repeat domain-containing protein [Pirellulales bacterium]
MFATTAIVLLGIGAPPSSSGSGLDRDQQLVVAAFELDIAEVRTLLAGGANPDARFGEYDEALFEDKWTLAYSSIGSDRWTPLLAVANSHREPQPESRTENTSEAFETAREQLNAIDPKLIRQRDELRVEVAKLLIAAKANLDLDDGHGATALSVSVDAGYESLSMLLISKGAEVNTKTHIYIDGPDNIAPVHRASDQPAVLAAMIKRGAKVNVQDSDGDTPLHWAASDHNVASVKLLLAAGADPRIKNNEGRTPIYWCRIHGPAPSPEDEIKQEIHRLLTEAKAKK